MQHKRVSIIEEKSFQFALNTIQIVKKIQEDKKEFILTKQLMCSDTSIGAMVREAEHAESKKDFIHKMAIGLKEANETRYWLELLFKSENIDQNNYEILIDENIQIIRLLAAIVKSSKTKLN